MLKIIKNFYTEMVWRISRKIFLNIRDDSPASFIDSVLADPYVSEKNILKYFLKTYQKEKKVLFDIGANIGTWSTLAINQDKNVSVFAFEAINQTYINLKKNFKQKNHDINIINKAISNEVGEFNIYNFGENEGTNSFFKNEVIYKDSKKIIPKVEKVNTTTIDLFCKDNNINMIDYIKCDTEGNDFNVILGSQEMFNKNSIIAFQFEYNWRWINSKSYLKNVFDLFENTDYLIGKITSDKVKLIDKWNPELEQFHENNYLIVNKNYLKNFKHDFYYLNKKNVLQVA